MNVVGENIRRLRKEKKLTQKQLAAELEVTQGVVHFWETGRNQPNIENLIKLSAVLDCNITELIPNDLQSKYDLLDNLETTLHKMTKDIEDTQEESNKLLDRIMDDYSDYQEIIDFIEQNPIFMPLFQELHLLNESGINKVFEYIQDLKNNPNYRNDTEK